MLNRTFKGALATCAVFALVPFLAAPDAVRTYVSGNFTAEIAGMASSAVRWWGRRCHAGDAN